MTNRRLLNYADHEIRVFADYLADIDKVEKENDKGHAREFPLHLIRRSMQLAYSHAGSSHAYLMAFDKRTATRKCLADWNRLRDLHFELYTILYKVDEKYGYHIF